MARKKTSWGAVLGVVGLAVVLWLIFTRTRKAKPAGSGGGGGLVGGSGGGGLPPQQKPPSSGLGLGGLPALGGGGGGGSSSALRSALKRWIGGVLNQGYANAALLDSGSSYIPGLGESPDLSIPYQSTSLFPLPTFDIPGADPGLELEDDSFDQSIPEESFDFGSYSPNDFLVTQDIPSGPSIDPYYGADQVSVQSDDLSNYLIDPGYSDQISEDANGTGYYDTGYVLGASTSGGGGGIDYSY